jgi:hypothetical protein
MPTISPFTPQTGSAGSSGLVPSVATANVLLPLGGGNQIRVCHTGSVIAYVNFGASTVAASATTPIGFAINPGQTQIFTFDQIATGSAGNQFTYAAAAGSAASVSPIIFTRGEGF